MSFKPNFSKTKFLANRTLDDAEHLSTIGRLKFHDDNEKYNENDNEISLSFSLRFSTQRAERLIASFSSSSATKVTDSIKGQVS